MALAQLIDYARAVDEPCHRAILLPDAPTPDVRALIQAAGVVAIWSVGSSFQNSATSRFALP
jgi:hypothetical protein